MARRKRTELQMAADAETHRMLLALGDAVRRGRQRRHLTQTTLAERAGMSKSAISRLERASGVAAGIPLRDIVAVGLALGATPRVEIRRDPREEPVDAGHLAIQELLLRLGKAAGYEGRFELPVRPVDPWRSIDVCLHDRRGTRYLVLEATNALDDVGAATRSLHRKLAAASEVAAGRGHPDARVHGAWIVRATKRNRELVARYPAVFASAFPGSSALWVRALTAGGAPPAEPGLVWSDVRATRLYAWRRAPAQS